MSSTPAPSSSSAEIPAHPNSGGRSLEDVHQTISIPQGGHWFRKLFAFVGPAYMVSVGYMDPGNWATDLEGGARFGYSLLWVLLMSNLMAVLLQTLSARLGLVTGRDLAQACADAYGPVVRWVLFILCEIAIAACDLAEVLGTAIGLNLLTAQFGMFDGHGVPLVWGVVLTGLDVFLLLAIQRFGIRKMEALIFVLVAMIGACFIIEIFLSKPSVSGIASGFIPGMLGGDKLLVAIGILGATVMPHNLYLHSALVQSRNVRRTEAGIRQACKYNFIDSAVALNCAFFVNAAILILAAAAFFSNHLVVNEIQEAHQLLGGLLGSEIAPLAFAIALICAGQSSTITGTLAGQITMEGFVHIRIRPWLRRLITRSIAIIPAVIVISISGDSGTYKLLILSQVVLSLQLPFAVVPLVKFTSSKMKMGVFRSPTVVVVVAWLVATVIISLNAKLVVEQIGEWATDAGSNGWIVRSTLIPLAVGLLGLLLWLTFRKETVQVVVLPVNADDVMSQAVLLTRKIDRVGVALAAEPADAPMLAEALALARTHRAQLILMHVVDGVGAQYHGRQVDDVESHSDQQYLSDVAGKLDEQLGSGFPKTAVALGYGDVRRELVRLAKSEKIDMLVVGGHGHRGLSDIIRGTTIDGVRHAVNVPLLAVRPEKK